MPISCGQDPAQKRIPGYQPCPLLRHSPESGVNTHEDTHNIQPRRKPTPNPHHHHNKQQRPIRLPVGAVVPSESAGGRAVTR